jgi:hypothetical protein
VERSIGSWTSPNETAITLLGRIASFRGGGFQNAAANALAFLHTLQTLPFLAQLLGSDNVQTRELAIQGMSRFVDGLPIQTTRNFPGGAYLEAAGPTPYRTPDTDRYSLSRGWLNGRDDKPYVEFWKAWWAGLKRELAPD